MATEDPFNSVYRGREGTGAAFLLGGNRAAEIFHNNIAQDDQQRRMLEFQKARAEREQRNIMDRSLSGIKLDGYWIAHDGELRNKLKGLMDYGAQLKVKGVNPTSDRDFKDMQARLDTEAKYSGQLMTGLAAFQKEVGSNPGKYSDESIAKGKAYYDPKKSISKYLEEGLTPPTLQPRYTLSGMLKNTKGSEAEFDKNGRIIKEADRSKNVKLVEGLQDTPEFQSFITEAGGNPGIGAFPIKNADGKTIYSTRDEDLLPEAQNILSNIQPSKYASVGIMATTPEEALPEMLAIMKQQNQVYGSVVSEAADQLDARVDGSNRKNYAEDSNEIARARLRISQQSENRIARKQAKDDAKDINDADYLNQLKSGVMGGDPEAVKRFNSFLSPVNGVAKVMNGGVIIDIPIEDKKTNDAFAGFTKGKTTTENGKKIRRYTIGNSSGQSGQIMLDNIFKQINLIKDNVTPKDYNMVDFGNSDEETIDFGNN